MVQTQGGGAPGDFQAPVSSSEASPSLLTYSGSIVVWTATLGSGPRVWYKRPEDSTTLEPAFFDTASPAGIAATNNVIYWTTNDAGNGTIRSCTADLNGGKCPPNVVAAVRGATISRIQVVAGSTLYFEAKQGNDTYIVQRP